MQHIDEARLESDVGYRFGYLVEFMGLTANDILAIHGSAALLAPLVAGLVDAVYEKLFTYDATKRHFLPRQAGYEGETPVSLESLTVHHEIIRFRKEHLGRYLKALVTRPYDGKMVEYLDMVGKIHTAKAGNQGIVVPLVQMNALMGFVSDALISTIFSLDIAAEDKIKTVRAFNKLLWLQNDLITRHYQG
ncbi:MAG: hypothetical protein JWM11_1782 [Planctomycetaceae bacterium]|nr:hypothetical protein [Planctomycetaceae bacterium]